MSAGNRSTNCWRMDFGCWKRLDSYGNSRNVPWGILMLTSSLVGGFSKGDGSHEHIRHIPMVGSWDWNELLAMLGFRQTSIIYKYTYIHILLYYYYSYLFCIFSLLFLLLLLFFHYYHYHYIFYILCYIYYYHYFHYHYQYSIIIHIYIYTYDGYNIWLTIWVLSTEAKRADVIGCDWMWLASIISGMTWYTLWWTYKKLWKMAIEIVDFPIENGDFPLLC